MFRIPGELFTAPPVPPTPVKVVNRLPVVVDDVVVPVEVLVSAAPLPPDAATETSLAVVAAKTAETVAATTAGLATVASTAAANSALLLTATNTVASTAAANSALLLAATDAVALAVVASDAVLVEIRDAVVAPPPVSVNNFPATQAVSVSNFPAIQPVSNTPVQNSGKTVNRFVLSQGGVAGTAVIAVASPGNKHKVIGVMLSMSAAGTVKFMDTTNLTGAMNMAAGTLLNLPPNPTFSLVETLTNRALNIVTTGGGANGVVLYLTEP